MSLMLDYYIFYGFIFETLVFAISLMLIPYFLYPKLVDLIYKYQPRDISVNFKPEQWPSVDIVFAAFNEESVIREKIESILALNYPKDLLKIRIGSDCSTDSTDLIIEEFQKREKIIDFVKMKTRSGKSKIINTLIQRSESKIIVGTDANIFFHPDALKEMILPIVNDNKIHLVGGNLVYRGNNKIFLNSIAKNEKSYINWENNLKNKEGVIWGSSMGVEGGCYAIRRESFKEIPFGTLMEDFFLTMTVLKSNKKVVIALKAICTEDVSNESNMEFKRKIRISQGNWQNLKYFYATVLTNPFPIGLVFFCHKILRWMLPIFFSLGSLVNIIFWLLQGSHIVMISIIFQMLFLILFILYPERFLPKTISNFLKPLSYFSWMNIALFLGLIRYLRTSENGIWKPTTRNKL